MPLTIGTTATHNATAAAAATASTTHNFSYTVVSGDSDGISVAGNATLTNPGAISDAAGNTMTATALPDTLSSNQTSHKVDTTRPTITGLSITSTGPYMAGDAITLQATFSEAVTIASTNLPGIPLTVGATVRNAATATAATKSTTHNFNYTVVGTDVDADGISVAAAAVLSNPGSIADTAGNAMTATALPDNLNSNQVGHKADTARPTITGLGITSTGPYMAGDVITLQATFSETVTISSTKPPSIPLTIGSTARAATATAAATASTTHSFSYTVAGSDSDTDGLSIATAAVLTNPGSISDAAGNTMTATDLPNTLNDNQSSHKVDNAKPVIASIAFTSTGPYKSGDVITLQATFSESVTIASTTLPGIPLTIGSTARNATAATTTRSTTHNFTYTVASTDSDTDGLSVATAAVLTNSGSISDAAGNTMTATDLPNTLNDNQSSHKVDNAKPVIASIAFTSTGPYKSGDVITLQATFSENVIIASTKLPSIPLTIGSTARYATAVAATKSTTHNFSYTVTADDSDTDGISIATAAVLTNPGNISDTVGNTMTATALPDDLNSAQSNHKVDNARPSLASIALTSTGPYMAADVITLQATFNESVTIASTKLPSIPLTIGSTTRYATAAAAATASSSHNFSYTVAGTDSDDNGLSVASSAVLANPGSIEDTAGNIMIATALPAGLNNHQSGHKVDNTAPTVEITAAAIIANITSGSYTITVTFSELVEGFTADDITLGGTATSKPTVGTPALITTGTAANRAYTVPITRNSGLNTAAQTITYTIAANAVTDRAGNNNSEGTASSTLRDAPGVIITAPPTTNTAYRATITFSEPVTGFEASDITVTNGTATLTGSGASYTATITPIVEGAVSVSIAHSAATSVATRQFSTASNTARTTCDITAPTVTISGVPALRNNHNTFTATFSFSEAVAGFEAHDITVTGGSSSDFTETTADTVWTASISPNTEATRVEVAVAQNVARDAAGNTNTAAASKTTTLDTTAPMVDIEAPATVLNAAGGSYNITVTFSEPVAGFTADAITISGTATHKPTVSTPVLISTGTAANRSYTVTITRADTANTVNQTITYTIAAGAVTDRAGNNNSDGTASSIIKDAPQVTISGTPAIANAAWPLTIIFTEPVTGFALDDIQVTNGTAAELHSDNARVYTATITPTADGDVTVSIAAGVVTGVDSRQPNRAANTVSTRYDNTPPTITISGLPQRIINAGNNTTFTATFTFSEWVTGFTASDIRVEGGSADNFTETTAGRVWTATITPHQRSRTLRIIVAAAVAHDRAGNANEAAAVEVELLSLASAERQQAAHKAMLPQLTQAVVSNAASVVAARIEATASTVESSLVIGGNSIDMAGLQAGGVQHFLGDTLPQLIASNEQALYDRRLNTKQLLAGTRFAVPLAARAEGESEEPDGRSSLTLWGSGNYRNLETDDANVIEWGGDVFSANLGLDMRLNPRLLIGIAITWSEAELDYSDNAVATAGRYDYELVSTSPYLGWHAGETVAIWLAAGFGEGEVTLFNAADDSHINSSKISVQSLSGGLKVQLLGGDSGKLSLVSDLSHSQTELDNAGDGQSLTLAGQRARLSLKTERALTLASGNITPFAQLGLRYDGGESEHTGTGIEAAAGMKAAFSNGWQITINARSLLESSTSYRDWEMSGAIHFQPPSAQAGWSFSFEPRYGGELASGGIEQLWQQGLQTPAEPTAASLSWRSELGYGFRPRRNRQWTYYGGMAADLNSSQVHIGSRLQWTEAIQLELEIRRRNEEQRDGVQSGFLLKAQLNF